MSIYSLHLLSYWVGEPGIYVRRHIVQGKEPGQDACLSQRTIAHYGKYANQPTPHVFVLGKKPEYPEETLQARGEHAESQNQTLGV